MQEENEVNAGSWLRQKRRIADLTQEEAATRAGMTRAMWAKLEGGKHGTKRGNIPGIAYALGTSPAETAAVFGYSPPKNELTQPHDDSHKYQCGRDLYVLLSSSMQAALKEMGDKIRDECR